MYLGKIQGLFLGGRGGHPKENPIFCFSTNTSKRLFQAVVGFLAGGLVWFAVPFGLATTMSLAYHGLSSAQGSDLLTKGEISRVNTS